MREASGGCGSEQDSYRNFRGSPSLSGSAGGSPAPPLPYQVVLPPKMDELQGLGALPLLQHHRPSTSDTGGVKTGRLLLPPYRLDITDGRNGPVPNGSDSDPSRSTAGSSGYDSSGATAASNRKVKPSPSISCDRATVEPLLGRKRADTSVSKYGTHRIACCKLVCFISTS